MVSTKKNNLRLLIDYKYKICEEIKLDIKKYNKTLERNSLLCGQNYFSSQTLNFMERALVCQMS